MIDDILLFAVEAKASDIHITANTVPCLRIDGEIYRFYQIPGSEKLLEKYPGLSEPLTPETIMSIVREMLPAVSPGEDFGGKKSMDFAYQINPHTRFRANVFYQKGSPAVALRALANTVPTIKELFSIFPQVAAKLYEFSRLPYGLILVTGPTGAGKSTTLAAMINEINETQAKHIITMEDPIEYIHDHRMSIVNQREIGRDVEDFASGLRAALREDPDVILVGEMRDLETVRIALQAAKTGHLVLSTLHTNTAAETIERIINMFPGEEQASIRVDLSEALQGVISQKLIKKKTGGRVPAVEIMVATPAIRAYIREGKTHQITSTIQTGKEDGMVLMEKSLSELIRQGLVSEEEAMGKTANKKLINQYYR